MKRAQQNKRGSLAICAAQRIGAKCALEQVGESAKCTKDGKLMHQIVGQLSCLTFSTRLTSTVSPDIWLR